MKIMKMNLMKCPKCGADLEAEWNYDYSIEVWRCSRCHVCWYESEVKHETKMPYEGLEETILVLTNILSNFPSNDSADIQRMLRVIEKMKDLYFKCPYCERMVAPDEQYSIDANGEPYCKECCASGI